MSASPRSASPRITLLDELFPADPTLDPCATGLPAAPGAGLDVAGTQVMRDAGPYTHASAHHPPESASPETHRRASPSTVELALSLLADVPTREPGPRETPYPCLACGDSLDPERLFCGDGCMADYRAGVRAFRPRPAVLCRHERVLWDPAAQVPRCGECRVPRPGAKAQVKG